MSVNFRKGSLYEFLSPCVKVAISVSLRFLYALPCSLRKDHLYAIRKEVVKNRKCGLYAFFTVSFRNRKFKISCCGSYRERIENERFPVVGVLCIMHKDP